MGKFLIKLGIRLVIALVYILAMLLFVPWVVIEVIIRLILELFFCIAWIITGAWRDRISDVFDSDPLLFYIVDWAQEGLNEVYDRYDE